VSANEGFQGVRGATRLLQSAIKAVPATKYALGVAGVAAAAFLVSVMFGMDLRKGSLAVLVMFILMAALIGLAAAAKDPVIRPAAVSLMYAYILMAVVVPGLLILCVFARWPIDLSHWLKGDREPTASTSPISILIVASQQSKELLSETGASRFKIALRGQPQLPLARRGILLGAQQLPESFVAQYHGLIDVKDPTTRPAAAPPLAVALGETLEASILYEDSPCLAARHFITEGLQIWSIDGLGSCVR